MITINKESRLQVLAALYNNAHFVCAVDRLLHSDSRDYKRNALHMANMDFFGFCFKILTSWEGCDKSVVSAIYELSRKHTELMAILYKEGASSSKRVFPSILSKKDVSALLAHPVLMSYAYFIHDPKPSFSSAIPSIASVNNTQNKKSCFEPHSRLNTRIRVTNQNYTDALNNAKTAIAALKGWVGAPKAEIYLMHKDSENKPVADWKQNTALVAKLSAWTKLLEVQLTSDEDFIDFTYQMLGCKKEEMTPIELGLLKNGNGHLIAPVTHKSGVALYATFEREIKEICPSDSFSLGYGDFSTVGDPKKDRLNEEKIQSCVQVEVKDGSFIAYLSIPDLHEIINNTEFRDEMSADWEKAKGVKEGYKAVSLDDCGNCLKMANAKAIQVHKNQIDARASYVKWLDKKKTAEIARTKLADIRALLENVNTAELGALLSDTEVAAIKRITKKLPTKKAK